MTEKLLIVDDEPELLKSCARLLQKSGAEIFTASDGREALQIVAAERPGVVLTDLRMPGMDGMDLIGQCLALDKDTLVILFTAYGNVETAVQAVKNGAFDFITKPFSADYLRISVGRALHQRSLLRRNRDLQGQLSRQYSFDHIIGKSPAMQKVFEFSRKIAATDSNILITGESGTGKELLARAIHLYSHRADQPFVPIDCASLPENLMESELFGHEKGAFTGALTYKQGLLESADGGTVFLDELGEIPLNLQAKLLRVLQERTFRRIGSTKERCVDIRILAATNRNLQELVQARAFRQDLYYRLNVIRVELPPLRERTGDVVLLAKAFVNELGRPRGILGLSPQVEHLLELYPWPGNVRQLRNTIEWSVTVAAGKLVQVEDLPPEIIDSAFKAYPAGDHSSLAGPSPAYADLPFSEAKQQAIDAFERHYLTQLMAGSNQLMGKAAVSAGIDRKTLYRLLKKHHMK